MTFTIHTNRSNRDIFIPDYTGSPHDGLAAHITGLGRIARLDFERCDVAGEVIFAIEGDSMPVSQQDEEARIGTLAYALKKLGNPEDAAEFIRCLNTICKGGDARSRQTAASYYYNEIAARETSEVLKEMALLALQMASLDSVAEVTEDDEGYEASYALGAEVAFITRDESRSESLQSFFDQEVGALTRMVRSRRKSACFIHDEVTEWLNDLEAGGASIEEMDDAFAHAEAMDQYDEAGAILVMSSHERTVACGRIDTEVSADDLPERARYLAGELRRGYANGVEMEQIWDEIDAQIGVIFPVSGKTENGGRFYYHANRELQRFTREVLEAIQDECRQDFHLTALRNNPAYRRFHRGIRGASDTAAIGEVMKKAYEARQAGQLPLKQFVALKAASALQRERLQSARLSQTAVSLIREIDAASDARLRYLSWAFYGNNQPSHLIHTIPDYEKCRVWQVLKARKEKIPAFRKAA